MRTTILVLLVLAMSITACQPMATPTPAPSTPKPPSITPPAVLNEETVEDYFVLTSPAFADGDAIPPRYTCHGEDVSPPLRWGSPPEGTAALLLTMTDPDAQQVVGSTWIHWLLYDLPPEVRTLEEVSAEPEVAGGRQGTNSWGKIGYGGPCPPDGPAHRYIFVLYALDAPLGLPVGATMEQVEAAMEGHVIATTQLVGLYASP